MKTAVWIAAFLVFVLANDTLWVDLDNTQISWVGRKVTGEHFGTLKLSDGFVVIKDEKLIDGTFIFDMSTIKNTDIETEKWNNKLVKHLKSEDFFIDATLNHQFKLMENHLKQEYLKWN